jgi:HAD superfamily hydrolase (TIGR01484 family)
MSLPRWIVTDLDETLLNADRKITNRSLAAIDALRRRGCFFAIATTRSESYAHAYIQQLQPDAMVLSGGALGYLHGKLKHHMPLQSNQVHQIIEQLEQDTQCTALVLDTSAGRMVWEQGIPLPEHLDVYALFFWSTSDLADRMTHQWAPTCTVTALWEPRMYRISHHRATKLVALQALLDPIPPSEVVTFGDDLMDIPMLAYYTGVAVANALPEVLQAASHHTKAHHEDGVAYWIETHLLAAD